MFNIYLPHITWSWPRTLVLLFLFFFLHLVNYCFLLQQLLFAFSRGVWCSYSWCLSTPYVEWSFKKPNQNNFSRPLSMLSTIVRQCRLSRCGRLCHAVFGSCRLSRCGPLCHAVFVTMPAQPLLPGGNAVTATMLTVSQCRH